MNAPVYVDNKYSHVVARLRQRLKSTLFEILAFEANSALSCEKETKIVKIKHSVQGICITCCNSSLFSSIYIVKKATTDTCIMYHDKGLITKWTNLEKKLIAYVSSAITYHITIGWKCTYSTITPIGHPPSGLTSPKCPHYNGALYLQCPE